MNILSATILRRIAASLLAGFLLILSAAPVAAGALDEMALDRWAKLRETERYQLNIAEKYFREQNWKVALDEYQKFLSLYESSEGAPYAQLKWSICQVKLRKLNTAIKDGFQSVLDYWPESPEAPAAAYFIARSQKDMGEVKAAKAAYGKVMAERPDHPVAVYSKWDLYHVAEGEKDQPKMLSLLKDVVFNSKRDPEMRELFHNASRKLAEHHFYSGEFAPAKDALAATWKDHELVHLVYHDVRSPVHHLTGQAEAPQKQAGEKLADAVVAWLSEQTPNEDTDPGKRSRAQEYGYWSAEIQSYSRRPDKVLAIYQAMEKRFGVDDGLLQRQGDWLKGQNRRDEARRTYDRFTNKIESQKQLAWMDREEKQYDAALLKYQGLIAQDPANTAQYQWATAETLEGAGKHKEAIAAYRQADVHYPENLKRMAGLHRHLKEYTEAILLYSQIAGARADQAPWAMLEIARTNEQAGDKEKAIKAYQQVCRLHPKSHSASEAHAHLQTHYKINITLGGATEE